MTALGFIAALDHRSVTAFLGLLITGLSLVLGVAVLSANPSRFTNQVFFALLAGTAGSYFCIYGAIKSANLILQGQTADPIPYLRANGALSAFSPWLLWLLKESMLTAEKETNRTIRRSTPWLTLSLFVAALCLTNAYIPSESSHSVQKRGWGYLVGALTMQAASLLIAAQAWLQMRKTTGIRRLELQFFVLNLSVASFVSITLGAAGNFWQIQALKLASVFPILFGYTFCAWAVTYQRVFDVRQVFVSLFQRFGLLVAVALGVVCLWRVFDVLVPPVVGLFFSVAIAGSLGLWLDRKSRHLLDLDGEQSLAQIRAAVIDSALNEPNPDKLVSKFCALLCNTGRSDFAALFFDVGTAYASSSIELRKDRPGCTALCETGWATPEGLDRRRSTPPFTDLHRFLTEHSLGVVVASPMGSRYPALVIALGTKTNQWPFTYPEVRRLQSIAELMDNILSRSRLATQAALTARVEHLAMMSRGLAHDLKNLITPISSYLIHTDNRFPPGGPEAEVHSAAKHSVRVMTDYVREALFFSERLAPHFQPVDFGEVFAAVCEVVHPRAKRREVAVSFSTTCHQKALADVVLLQRLLANLVDNAIDASGPGQTVTLSATDDRVGWISLQVTDQGCGIAPDLIGKIFDPYFTTKEFGEDVRGFGLGLTISQKIVHIHHGTISVKSEPDRGATFTVKLPVSPAV